MDNPQEFWNIDLPDELLKLFAPTPSPGTPIMDTDYSSLSYEVSFPDLISTKRVEPEVAASNPTEDAVPNPNLQNREATDLDDDKSQNSSNAAHEIPSKIGTKPSVQHGLRSSNVHNSSGYQPIFTIFDKFRRSEDSGIYHTPASIQPTSASITQSHEHQPTKIQSIKASDLTLKTFRLKDSTSTKDSETGKAEPCFVNDVNSGKTDDIEECSKLLEQFLESKDGCICEELHLKTTNQKKEILKRISKLVNERRDKLGSLEEIREKNKRIERIIMEIGTYDYSPY